MPWRSEGPSYPSASRHPDLLGLRKIRRHHRSLSLEPSPFLYRDPHTFVENGLLKVLPVRVSVDSFGLIERVGRLLKTPPLDYNVFMTWGLIGHAWAVELLRKHLQSGRMRHAYLFTGPESVGKRTLALRFAKALNCKEAPEQGQFCGECRVCKLVDLEQYPDLHVVESQEDTQELHVDQVRALQRQLALTPVESRWRVALLPNFEEAVASSQASAANALLKTLEEPPPHVILLLTAPSKEVLLPTVVSRCEVVPLRAVPLEVIEQGLLERGVSPEQASLFASVSAGRPGAAIGLALNPVEVERRASMLEDFAHVLGMKRADRFDYVENMVRSNDYQENREKALRSLELWSTLWRDAMVLHCHAGLEVHHPDSMEMLKGMAALERREILNALLAIGETITAVHRYANTRLAMEVVMLSMPYLKL